MPESIRERRIGWVLAALVACALLAVAASSAVVVIASNLIGYEQRTADRHSAYCTGLAARVAVERAHPVLAPLVPADQAAYATGGCPGHG